MSSSPLISVVIAVFNNVHTLEQALTSVTSQTYQAKELLVIDGNSSDGSLEIIKNHSGDISYWVSEPDQGIYQAWNKALKKIKGEWVIFLGADDYFWDDRVLGKASERLKNLEESIGIFYGLVNVVNFDGKTLYTAGKGWEQSKKELVHRTSIPHPGTFHRHRLFKQYGSFDENLKIAGDYDFLLRVLRNEEAIFCDDFTITAMRYGGISSSFKTARLRLREDYMIKKKNGLSILNYYWFRKVFITYARELLILLVGENKARDIELKTRKSVKKESFWDHV